MGQHNENPARAFAKRVRAICATREIVFIKRHLVRTARLFCCVAWMQLCVNAILEPVARSLPDANVDLVRHEFADEREASKAAPPAADESLVPKLSCREASMIAEHADCRLLGQNDPFGRRLRNRIILANAIAWIAIIALIGVMFL
jgi:hypothetical protein